MNLPLPPAVRLRVSLEAEGGSQQLCGLARADRGLLALEWTPASLATAEDAGANIAVRQAPHIRGVHIVGNRSLGGLPGFLADSLPDAWGRLLLDRRLVALGVDPSRLTGFDRLAVVGGRGPGALSFAPESALGRAAQEELDLDQLAKAAERVLSGGDAELLAVLERAGGSAGGSRPKVWIAEAADGSLRSGAHTLAPDETGWLVKFRAPQQDPEDVGPLEYAYAQMAIAAGLDVAVPRLFETSKGRYFGSRRFDREGTGRVHVLTAAGLLNVAPEEAMAADYVDLLKLTRHVTRSQVEVRGAFRHAVFNVVAHNRDDHLKQFAFIRRAGRWTRTPAYDLTYAPGPAGEHTLLVAGEGRDPGRADLLAVADRAGLSHRVARRVFDEVCSGMARWDEIASEVGVGAESTRRVAAAIQGHITR